MLPLSRTSKPFPGTQEVPGQDKAEKPQVKADRPIEGVNIWIRGRRERE